jgi:hypothetical protein
MNEFFKLLSAYPTMLMLLIVLATLTWAFYIVAFVWILINGGEASLWPPGIKVTTRAVGSSAQMKIEVATQAMPPGNEPFYKDVQLGKQPDRSLRVPIKYTVPFKKPPQIFLALKNIDVGGSAAGGPIDRLRLKTEAERTDGFTLVFETWNDSIVFGDTAATWIGFGE